MGRPLPGYQVTLVDLLTGEPARDGEICLDLSRRPLGLMTGYLDDETLNTEAMRGGYYHTGDVATSDEDGYITYVGRTDDVFKASDYRISPFELESILIEHEAVAEAAVVPSPDPVRLAVPKAYILLAAGREPSPELAQSIMAFCRERVAPYKRIRRLEFGDLPKTISGKIRRVELRAQETTRPASPTAPPRPPAPPRPAAPLRPAAPTPPAAPQNSGKRTSPGNCRWPATPLLAMVVTTCSLFRAALFRATLPHARGRPVAGHIVTATFMT